MIQSEEFHPVSASPRPTQDSYSQQLNLYARPKMIEPQKCAIKWRSARLTMYSNGWAVWCGCRGLLPIPLLKYFPLQSPFNPLSELAQHTDCLLSGLSGAASPRLPPNCGIQLRSASDGTVGGQELLLSR